MILRIGQVTANGYNSFEITQNGQLIFKANTPFYKPNIPIGGDVFRKLILTDTADDIIMYTDYDAVQNLAASSLPLSWLYLESKQVCRYIVMNNADQPVGEFYFEQTGLANTKYVAVFLGRVYYCYVKEAGKREVVSVYENEMQIGQITKPNCVIDNLDQYLAHFLDGYVSPAMVSFFTIYYDFMRHNHSGQIMKGWRKNTTYTIDKNSKFYNKDFIMDNFGAEENERVEQFIKDAYNTKKKPL